MERVIVVDDESAMKNVIAEIRDMEEGSLFPISPLLLSAIASPNYYQNFIMRDGSPKFKTYGSRFAGSLTDEQRKALKNRQGRNERCKCGSGLKFKNCHGK